MSDAGELDALLQEDRRFPPSDAFAEQANLNDPGLYDRAAADPEGYWSEWASELRFW